MGEVFDGHKNGFTADDVVDGSTGLVALISPDKLANLQRIWGLSQGGIDSSYRLRIVLDLFAKLLDADNCSWLASCHMRSPSDIYFKELFDGWWASDIVDYRENTNSDENLKAYLDYSRQHGVDPITHKAVKSVGKSRVVSRKEIFSEDEWMNHPLRNEFLIPQYNTAERMLAIYTIDSKSESYFVIDRKLGREAFSDQDMQLAFLAMTGMAALHQRLFFERGFLDPATKPLSPREREVFSLLLEDVSEKEIAERIGVSVHTAHQYITSIYRIFKVRGRTGLLSALMKATQ